MNNHGYEFALWKSSPYIIYDNYRIYTFLYYPADAPEFWLNSMKFWSLIIYFFKIFIYLFYSRCQGAFGKLNQWYIDVNIWSVERVCYRRSKRNCDFDGEINHIQLVKHNWQPTQFCWLDTYRDPWIIIESLPID